MDRLGKVLKISWAGLLKWPRRVMVLAAKPGV